MFEKPILGESSAKVDLPSHWQGKAKVKQWHSVPFVDAAGKPDAANLRRTSTVVPAAKLSKTIRVSFVKSFMEASLWQQVGQQPTEAAMKLLQVKMNRGEAWRLQSHADEAVLTGYLMGPECEAFKALKVSGKHGTFCEQLQRDQPAKDLVQWVPPGTLQGLAYLREVSKQAQGQPLAFRKGGGASLGFKLPAGQARKGASAWRVRNVPRWWSRDDLIEVIEGAGFSELPRALEAMAPEIRSRERRWRALFGCPVGGNRAAS